MEIPYPEEYIAVQSRFARRMASLRNEPVTETLRTMTSLYKMLGASGDFDADEPVWRGLLACLNDHPGEAEQARAIHRYYLSRYAAIPKFGDERHWGCFAYEWRPAQRALRLHFSNEDAPEPGALSRQRVAARQAELRAMLHDAREEHTDAEWIIGGSWLYTLEAYRRLFPPVFTATATADEPHIQHRAL